MQPACFPVKRSPWWLQSLPVWRTCVSCTTVMITSWWTSTGTSASTARCGMRNLPSRRNSSIISLSWQTTAPITDSGQTHPARNQTVPRVNTKQKPDYHFSFSLTGFVISWISQQVELFVLPSTKLLLAGRTAALRTVPSPKPTSPLWVTRAKGPRFSFLFLHLGGAKEFLTFMISNNFESSCTYQSGGQLHDATAFYDDTVLEI